jgi:Tol biopolymer transport system component
MVGRGVVARTGSVAFAVAAITISASLASAGPTLQTQRASVSTQETQATASSSQPALSADGRFLAFVSTADNLVPRDTNGAADVFLRDLTGGKTTRVSVAGRRVQANGTSSEPSLSANGRYLAFVSSATNLAQRDENDQADVFVRDLKLRTTKRISLGIRGAEPNCACFDPVISGNGLFVAFSSFASNLVPRDTNRSSDVFVRDLRRNRTTRVSIGPANAQANGDSNQPSISANGQFVAFASEAANLATGDSNGRADIYLRDSRGRKTLRVSRGLRGQQSDGDSLAPSISANGLIIAFSSTATNLIEDDSNGVTDVFVSGSAPAAVAERVSTASDGTEGNDESLSPSLSANGRQVAFHSYATNLVATDANGARDVFVHVVRSNAIRRASISSSGTEGDAESFAPSLSSNGRRVAFTSSATNLVGDDTNAVRDVFVR